MYKKIAKTDEMSRDEWLRYRKLGIGGSDAGAICGVNPYASPISVYQDKTTDVLDTDDHETTRQGRDLEDYVARRFMGVSKTSLDTARLKEERPEIYEEYKKTTDYRRFSIKETA